MAVNPDWISPRSGHDWRDDDLMLAVSWLKSLVPRHEMERRINAAKANLTAAWKDMSEGRPVSLYDPSDAAAWYLLQAETFAADRLFWTPDGAMRVVPYLTRIGKELPSLLRVKGVEERAARMMLADRQHPDSAIYELLVALAYKRRGWDRVEFVPETPGRGRTPDLHVYRPRSKWAVECKRLLPSNYAAQEHARGVTLAKPVHSLALEIGESLVIEIGYKIELDQVPDNYLIERVRSVFNRRSDGSWDDHISSGHIRPMNWSLARKILEHDDVYFGGSRMIEILAGYYIHEAGHSLAAKWRPSSERPAYAAAVYQASIVSWHSLSVAARRQKARHFRRVLARAEGQLPSDRPGVIHIGIESSAGFNVDFARHFFNSMQARLFKTKKSRLRWVYGNYFVPEATTRRDEGWAITETMVPYKVGKHQTRWPLPGHMLVSPEAEGEPGTHWDKGPPARA